MYTCHTPMALPHTHVYNSMRYIRVIALRALHMRKARKWNARVEFI